MQTRDPNALEQALRRAEQFRRVGSSLDPGSAERVELLDAIVSSVRSGAHCHVHTRLLEHLARPLLQTATYPPYPPSA